MQHIEKGECRIITQEVFERRRAEKAITKDAWAAQLRPDIEQKNVPRGNMSTFSEGDTTEHGGVSLLDEDNLLESNVQINSEQDYLTPSLGMLNFRNQYPTLTHLNAPKQTKDVHQENSNGLLSFAGDQTSMGKARSKAVWNASTPAASTLFKNAESPRRQTNQNSGILDGSSVSTLALSSDPNAHLSTKPAPLVPVRVLDPMNHYHSLTKKFECPGQKCGGNFDSIEAFNAHLISSAHVGGRTVCPSCLCKFTSTMSLVAHCESPSKRCNIRKSANYNQVLREITGGLIGAEGHHIDGSVRYVANDISKPGYW